MTKILKTDTGEYVEKGNTTRIVRNAKTGQFIAVKGVGALKNNTLKIKKGVDLLKPIAKQALTQRPDKRKAS